VKVAAIRVRERLTTSHRRPGPERWLLIELHADGMLKYYISNLPESTSVRRMIHLAHSRYKVEQGYQHLKEELGMDHYEGRFWMGFHHHVTLCFMAYDFLTLLQKEEHSKKTRSNERPDPHFIASHAA
jgi:SRSO17 transposase